MEQRRAGGGLPFISEHRLEAARRRLVGGGPAERRLVESARRIRSRRDLADPLSGPHGVLPFVAQNVVLEAALAHRLTGDEEHLRPVRDLLERLGAPGAVRRYLPDEVYLGFVAVGVAVAQRLAGPALDGELTRHVLVDLGATLEESSRRAPWGQPLPSRYAWNHTVVGWAGLGTVGLALAGEPWGLDWARAGVAAARRFLEYGVTETGMTREGLEYAGGFVFRNLAPFLLACRAAGLWDYRDPDANPWVDRMSRVPRWYAAAVLPAGGWLDNLNDSNGNPGRALGGLLPLFSPLAPDTCAWVHHRLLGDGGCGSHGQDLTMRASALFESVLWPPTAPPDAPDLPELMVDGDVGYVWESHARGRGFALNCGRFRGGLHDQSDNGHVTLWDRVPLLLDSGAANDPVEGSASSSAGHNVVLVDGRGQLPAGAGAGASGAILRVETGPAATVVSCDLTPAYRQDAYVDVTRAVRHVVHVKAPVGYLLVVDDVVPTRRGAFVEQLFHTCADGAQRTLPQGFEVDVELDGASARLTALALDPARVRTTPMATSARPFADHTVWRLGRSGPGPFATVLLTSDPGHPAPDVCGEVVRVGEEVLVRVMWRDGERAGEDELTVPCAPAPASLLRDGEPLRGRALLAPPPVPVATARDASPTAPARRSRRSRMRRRVARVLRRTVRGRRRPDRRR